MSKNRSYVYVLGQVFVVFCFIACFLPIVMAQTNATATLSGDVKDEGGNALPGVTVS